MAQPGHFALTHHDWEKVPAEAVGERASLRRIRGGASEAAQLRLDPRATVRTSGLPTECFFTVVAGRLLVDVLGNRVDLEQGHFALVPPHVPLQLHNPGRSPAALVAHCSSIISLATNVLLEAL